MKICLKCGLEKQLDSFSKNSRNNDKLETWCKNCVSNERKLHYDNIKDYYNTKRREKYNKNKEENRKKRREKYIKNRGKILANNKHYIENNSEYKNKVKEYQKEYHKTNGKEYRNKNKDRLKEYDKNYRKNPEVKKRLNKNITLKNKIKKSKDPLYKLTCSIRSIISNNFKSIGFKKSERTEKILCCSFEEFKLYLESKFEDWMNWDNKGLYNPEKFNFGWDIDHIIPLSTAKCEEDIIKLNHFTNLQPLCSKINREIKSNRIDYEMSI